MSTQSLSRPALTVEHHLTLPGIHASRTLKGLFDASIGRPAAINDVAQTDGTELIRCFPVQRIRQLASLIKIAQQAVSPDHKGARIEYEFLGIRVGVAGVLLDVGAGPQQAPSPARAPYS